MIANDTAAHTIVRAFRRHGVEVAFGQSIPTAFHLVAPSYGLRQFAYRTENAGVAMADGFARISHRVGLVTAQNGPAATLLVFGLAECLKASVPVVALVQDVARATADKNAFQEIDHLALFSGVAKWVRRVALAERIDDYVDMAMTAATSGRPGPAVLIVPIDLFGDPTPADSGRIASLGAYPLDRPAADPASIDVAAALLATADHPLVVAGGGVHSSDAAATLAALQESAHLPVATTSMGKGAVDESHPLSVGVVGYFMGRRGMGKFMRPLVDQADVVLLVGTRTNQNGTDSWKLFSKSTRFIHLDIDGQEIGRNYEALRLQGDARATLAALVSAMAARDLSTRALARPAVEAAIREGRMAHAQEAAPMATSTASPIRPERIMAEIDRRLTPETIMVADASYASIWINNYLRARRAGQRFLTPRGIAGLGYGLPMAIGAKVAAPDRPVIAIAGDGGFAHVWAELETAKRMGTPIPLTVLNNQVLGFQKHAETARHGAYTDACEFHPVDHAAIARACGCIGVRIEDPADYGPALDAALAADRPTVIDVVTDPDAYPPITMFDGPLGGER